MSFFWLYSLTQVTKIMATTSLFFIASDRGLGFIYVGEKYEQTGGFFPPGSFGHIGHTGQSVFVDPKSGLYTVILSDARLCVNRKFGGAESDEVEKMRRDIHSAIKKDMNLSL